VGRLRARLAGLFGWDAGVTDAIGSWDDVKLLEVTMDRLARWHPDGLLPRSTGALTRVPFQFPGVAAVSDTTVSVELDGQVR